MKRLVKTLTGLVAGCLLLAGPASAADVWVLWESTFLVLASGQPYQGPWRIAGDLHKSKAACERYAVQHRESFDKALKEHKDKATSGELFMACYPPGVDPRSR